ncbi:MAG TPA: MFS transporter [Verrucomicrobiae bacterium]|nr:MFS transporter [Verrucomicrobiae bacterium]
MNISKGFRYRAACFTLEGSNSFATFLYLNYLYFFMEKKFAFGDKENLAVAAWLGLIYIFTAWQAGKFAQRHGYFFALKLGFTIMAVSLAAALMLSSVVGQIMAASFLIFGLCFIWPTLEALVSDGEPAARLPHAIGIYNVVWAVTAAVAFFIGGTLIETFGYRIIFALPLAMVLLQLALTFWLQNHAAELARETTNPTSAAPAPEPHQPASPEARSFLRMAWLANPFAYIAINTLVAVIPGIAAKFHLSPMFAGFVCSLWCFVRLGAFLVLWHWTGWHYRFGWLATAFLGLILSFATILLASNLALLIAAQILFGGAIGLIYYSSLFYSMDAGDTRGEHGGIHEAAIGIGNCVGPAVGAASLQIFPEHTHNGAIAVSVLLLGGFGGLLTIWKRAN